MIQKSTDKIFTFQTNFNVVCSLFFSQPVGVVRVSHLTGKLNLAAGDTLHYVMCSTLDPSSCCTTPTYTPDDYDFSANKNTEIENGINRQTKILKFLLV